jgi:hypothetical protein
MMHSVSPLVVAACCANEQAVLAVDAECNCGALKRRERQRERGDGARGLASKSVESMLEGLIDTRHPAVNGLVVRRRVPLSNSGEHWGNIAVEKELSGRADAHQRGNAAEKGVGERRQNGQVAEWAAEARIVVSHV